MSSGSGDGPRFPARLRPGGVPAQSPAPAASSRKLAGSPVGSFVGASPGASSGAGVGTPLLRPQRLLHEAAREAARLSRPSGLGMDSDAVRRRMVERLSGAGVHPRVLQAFADVPRHVFVDTALATQAYEDTALPIGWSQTISKPSVVARMLSLLFEGRHAREHDNLGRVLEIGTGCGYQTALLAGLARHVVSIERIEPLHHKARGHLSGLPSGRVRLVFGDGRLGHAPNAPYHTVIAAAGGEALPAAWLDQLADGGRLIAPMHDTASGGQVLVVVDKHGDTTTRRQLDAVHFVPLKSGTE
jgi:protein-L-isoaspartate(D-aspartate) O-methyltransferase